MHMHFKQTCTSMLQDEKRKEKQLQNYVFMSDWLSFYYVYTEISSDL